MFGASKPAFGASTASTPFGASATNNAQSSGFGAASNTSGGLFGNNTNTSNAASGFGANTSNSGFGGANSGAFGANNAAGSTFGNNASSSGGLFGNNSNTNTSGGLFGNNSNTNTSGGLFGNKPAAPANTSGGLFGNNPTSNTGGLFGNNNQTNTTNTSSGGLFGNNNTSQNNTSGGLFGNTNTSGAGLFGNNSATKPASGGLFGNTSNTNNTSASGGLFGNSGSQNAGSGGLFGNANTSSTTGGGLFGNNSTNNNTNTTGGLLGGNTSNNLSGGFLNSQPQQQQQQNPLFGLANTQSQNQLFASNSSAAPVNYTPSINDQLTKIIEQWDPTSPNCILKTHFYNKVNPNDLSVLLNQPRPANESPDDWNKAMSGRPNNQTFPVKVTSFSDVLQRVEWQTEQVNKSRVLLNLINDKQSALSSKHDLENSVRIKKAKAKHIKLSRRLLRLATVLAILKLKGYPLLPEEEEISKQFELLNQKLNDPNSSLSKLNDAFARLTILKERAQDLNQQANATINSMNNAHPVEDDKSGKSENDVDEKANQEFVSRIANLLLKQQKGLNFVNEILEKDLEAVDKLVK